MYISREVINSNGETKFHEGLKTFSQLLKNVSFSRLHAECSLETSGGKKKKLYIM